MSFRRRLSALLALGALGIAVTSGLPASAGSRAHLLVRESVPALSEGQRQAYVRAVLALKHTQSPYAQDRARGYSWYDTFVNWHWMLLDCGDTDLNTRPRMIGHGGPMFLPWHREYLHLFEQALAKVSGHPVAVPYWDWADPSKKDRGEVESVFSDDFMGSNGNPSDGDAVDTGPFTRTTWPLVVADGHGQTVGNIAPTTYLSRAFGTADQLPTLADERAALADPQYDVAPYDDRSDPAQSFRNALEGFAPNLPGQPVADIVCVPDRTDQPGGGTLFRVKSPTNQGGLHNLVHNWFGPKEDVVEQAPGVVSATMTQLPGSPNDPVFFLHHAQVDRLWALWQAHHSQVGYQPVAESADPHNALHSPMFPFDQYGIRVTPADVLDTRELGYAYAAPSYDPSAGTAGTRGSSRSLSALAGSPDWWCA